MEFLLVNHPLDCPICDQGGECDLQVSLLKNDEVLRNESCSAANTCHVVNFEGVGAEGRGCRILYLPAPVV